MRLPDLWPFRRRRARQQSGQPGPVLIELRLGADQFAIVRRCVENTTKGEQAGFLLCGVARVGAREVLLAREWIPVPEAAVVARGREYGLEWSSEFSAEVLRRADEKRAAVVLVHSHGASSRPELSGPDRRSARRLFPGFSRVLRGKPCGSVVLGQDAAAGQFWIDGTAAGELERLRIVGPPITFWTPDASGLTQQPAKRRHHRMVQAIGPEAEAKLAAASVAVIGVCGGGSHVCQQVAHMGVGRIIPVDGDVVEDVNLGRMIGATPSDVGDAKTEVMRRLILSIDPDITVDAVPSFFPEPPAVSALKSADVVISCVDSFLVRDQINTFCRRHHLPLVDIGLGIKTADQKLVTAYGQVIAVTPDSACLRCGPLLSDEVLAREREEAPPGYDKNPYAPGAPQVVSMNGTLASEACNTVLDLITGYAAGARGAGWWLYVGRRGSFQPCQSVARRSDCPACAEFGHGDPDLSR